MDEDQIFDLIQRCKHLKYYFVGIYGADNFPLNLEKDRFIIVNSGKANTPGQHWLLLATTSYPGMMYYADPLGFPINYYADVQSRINAHPTSLAVTNLIQGKEPLQSLNSQMCGLFCIYIAHFLYNKQFFQIPQISEIQLLDFLRHMYD